MQHPNPSDFEARTNATYDALMWALSRPGMPRPLPAPGQAGLIEALIDRECAVFTDDPALSQAAARTGAQLVEAMAADHLFLADVPSPALLREVRQGSDLYPDDGATLVMPAVLGSGERLKLTGPGVDGMIGLSVGGLAPAFWAERARLMRYPQGFEIFLVDGDQIVGLPRSTTIEVL